MRLITRSLTTIVALLGFSIVFAHGVHAAPATFTVTNTLDGGAGSLRQAIEDANTNGNTSDQDIIQFNIPSPYQQTIQPLSPLSITQSVLIDGYTQSDAQVNTALAPNPLNGRLRIAINLFQAGGGISVTAPDVTLKGLAISQSQAGGQISLNQADNFKLLGDYVGTDASGLLWSINASSGINSINVIDSSNVRIGGYAPADRNVIGRCAVSCIYVEGTSANPSDNLTVQGNNIGVGADSITDLSNGMSVAAPTIYLNGAYTQNALIGGDTQGAGNNLEKAVGSNITAKDTSILSVLGNRILNSIANNNQNVAGVELIGVTGAVIGDSSPYGRNILSGLINTAIATEDSPDTLVATTNIDISSNYFGVMDDGLLSYPNSEAIKTLGNTRDVAIHGNIIKNTQDRYPNGSSGVTITGNSQNVSVTGNSIARNRIGIDLNSDGTENLNDDGDNDTGANTSLNTPQYTSVTESGGDTTFHYVMNTQPGDYRVEFFSNSSADSAGHLEGETYLGFQNITVANVGVEQFSHTLTGITGVTNPTLTATLIDPSTPSGLGPTSEFGGISNITDLALTQQTLTNPVDIVIGGTITYQMTITNHGPVAFDIGPLDGSIPGQTSLMLASLSPDLEYSGSSGTDISCTSFGPGSASLFGSAFSNHSDYEVVNCGYTGGTHVLNAGESITFTLSATIGNNPDLAFANLAFTPPPQDDPDSSVVVAGFNTGGDIVDYFGSNPTNNFSPSIATADLNVQKTLLDPEDVVPGHTISYQIAVTNNGPQGIDLARPNALNGAIPLVADLYPANDLTFLGAVEPNIACLDIGPGSYAYLGSLASNHTSYQLLPCNYTVSQILAPGGTFTFTLQFVVKDNVGPSFANFAILPILTDDPDEAVFEAAQNAGTDVLDSLTMGNLSKAAFGTPSGNSTSGSSQVGRVVKSGALSNTGQDVYTALIAVAALIIASGALVIYARRKPDAR